jgi:primosomal replication protein N''
MRNDRQRRLAQAISLDDQQRLAKEVEAYTAPGPLSRRAGKN